MPLNVSLNFQAKKKKKKKELSQYTALILKRSVADAIPWQGTLCILKWKSKIRKLSIANFHKRKALRTVVGRKDSRSI